MRLKARATFNPTIISWFNIPKGEGYLVLRIDDEQRAKVGEELQKISKRQRTKYEEAKARFDATPPQERGKEPVYADFLLDLELDLVIHYQRRTVDQNALYWALRGIQANWANGSASYRHGYHSKFLPNHIITPEELHEADVETFCEKRQWRILRKDLFSFKRAMEYGELGRVTSERAVPGDDEKLDVTVTRTTSFFTTKEMSEWTNRLINEIKESGLLKCDEADFLMLKKDFEEIVKGGRK